jgi:hypothetical protein
MTPQDLIAIACLGTTGTLLVLMVSVSAWQIIMDEAAREWGG